MSQEIGAIYGVLPFTDDEIEAIARTCHEANRAYCEYLGDRSHAPWPDAPDWQRENAIIGVRFLLENPAAGPEAAHASWCETKVRDGWAWGPTRDPNKRTHPCLVGWKSLPAHQRFKDELFHAIVRSAAR